MIGSVHSSDTPAYVPLVRGSGEPSDRARSAPGGLTETAKGSQAGGGRDENSAKTDPSATGAASTKTRLSEPELAMVRELKQRDQKVHQHEMAHIAASGGLAQGGPNYTYQRGPDGQNYAVGGHVNLDISPGKTPVETLQKARTIRSAAMAPAEPSGQDRAVAARASQLEAKARIELAEQQAVERSQQSHRDDDSPTGRLARRFFSAITPSAEPFVQVAA